MNIELYVNATSQAYMMTIRRLIDEIAKSKGQDAEKWLTEFREQIVSDINSAKNMDGTSRDPAVVSTSIGVVQALTTFHDKK